MSQLDSVAAPYGDIVAFYPSHCFIPTVSALAYNTTDLFHNIAADPNPVSNTPFDAIYSQGTNQEHVAITPQNAAWIKDEVEMTVTGVEPIAGVGVKLWRPWPSPSSGPVRIAFSLARPEAVDLRVFGVDGREVAHLARGVWSAGNHEVAWSGRNSSGASAASTSCASPRSTASRRSGWCGSSRSGLPGQLVRVSNHHPLSRLGWRERRCTHRGHAARLPSDWGRHCHPEDCDGAA
jgi:hypothetical protein